MGDRELVACCVSATTRRLNNTSFLG